ncbi:MAG: nickel-type superoxide dismutase maturation protease [Caldilineaceae bacterium]
MTIQQSGLSDWLQWLVRRRRLVRVTGRSMMPLLQPGDLLFVDPDAYRYSRPLEDELVVAIHPHQPTLKIVKRVGASLLDERFFLSSDNPLEGTDSRAFGTVPLSGIVGQVTGFAIKSSPREKP